MKQTLSLGINKKLSFLVFASTFVAIIIVAILSLSFVEQIILDNTSTSLSRDLEIRGNAIEDLFGERMDQIQILSSNPMIQNLVSELNISSNLKEEVADTRRLFLIETRAFQELIGYSIGVEDVKIFGKNDMPYFSLVTMNEDNSIMKERFKKGLHESFGELEKGPKGQTKMIISIPIINDASKSIGVIIVKMRTDSISNIISQSGLGDTNKSYLIIDKTGNVHSEQISNASAMRCFENDGSVGGFYERLDSTIAYGTSYCMNEYGLVLISEIDREEMMSPVLEFQKMIVISGIAVTLGMVFVALVLSRLISNPIIRMRDAVNEIRLGNYSVKTNIKSSDEIGDLSIAVDDMAKQIQEDIITIKQKDELIKQQKDVLLQFADYSESYFVGIVDIIDSTKIASKMSDHQMSRFYETFLNLMASVIRDHNGIVAKNIGDALLFYFPSTKSVNKDEIHKAMNCCIELSEAHDKLNQIMSDEDLPKCDYRISATYGLVRIANIATSYVNDIFGPTVNRCSKINSFAPYNQVVVGEALYEIIKMNKDYTITLIQTDPERNENNFKVFCVRRNVMDKITTLDNQGQ